MQDCPRFRGVILHSRVDSYALLTRLPCRQACAVGIRLACLRHAASVHPEPGSNSQKKFDVVKFFAARQQSLREPQFK